MATISVCLHSLSYSYMQSFLLFAFGFPQRTYFFSFSSLFYFIIFFLSILHFHNFLFFCILFLFLSLLMSGIFLTIVWQTQRISISLFQKKIYVIFIRISERKGIRSLCMCKFLSAYFGSFRIGCRRDCVVLGEEFPIPSSNSRPYLWVIASLFLLCFSFCGGYSDEPLSLIPTDLCVSNMGKTTEKETKCIYSGKMI